MPTEYTGMLSIDGTRTAYDDGEHCAKCNKPWPRGTSHECEARPEPPPDALWYDTREALLAIPHGVRPKPGLSSVASWNRYDTDDEHVLSLRASDGQPGEHWTWDIRVPKSASGAPVEGDGLNVERLAQALHRRGWICGIAHPGIKDAPHVEQAAEIASEYASLSERVYYESRERVICPCCEDDCKCEDNCPTCVPRCWHLNREQPND